MTGWGWLVTSCSTRSFLIIKTFPSAADCCWICPSWQHLVQTIIQSPSHLMPDDFGLGHLEHILAIKSYKWQDHFWYQPNKGHRRAILGLLGAERITVSIKSCVNKNDQTIHFSQGRNARMIFIWQGLEVSPRHIQPGVDRTSKLVFSIESNVDPVNKPISERCSPRICFGPAYFQLQRYRVIGQHTALPKIVNCWDW